MIEIRRNSKEDIAKKNSEYYEKNKERIAVTHKKYYEENKDRIAEMKRKYYADNKKHIDAQHKKYYEVHKESLAADSKIYRENNKERIAERDRIYYVENKERIAEYRRIYYIENKERIAEYLKNNPDVISRSNRNQKSKRRGWGTQQAINEWFEGCHLHHLHINDDRQIAIFIPATIHKYIRHAHNIPVSMVRINLEVLHWYYGLKICW